MEGRPSNPRSSGSIEAYDGSARMRLHSASTLGYLLSRSRAATGGLCGSIGVRSLALTRACLSSRTQSVSPALIDAVHCPPAH